MNVPDVKNIQAVFWDFDGIILDTEPLHHAAFQDVFERVGIDVPWNLYQKEYIGFDDRDALEHAFKSQGMELDADHRDDLIQSKATAFLKQLEQASKTPYPGVLNLLHHWSGKIPQVICSGALMSDIDPILDELDIRSCFDGMVTADQVAVSKPHPETYAKGIERARQLNPNLVADRCLAIEDTPAGISAAKSAGLPVLAVTNTHSENALGEADWVVDCLSVLLDS